MRKLHWPKNGTTYCRPTTKDKLRRELANSVPDVTCKPCLQAMGLSAIVFKASSAQARATIILPGGKRAECLVEDFEIKIVNAPALDNTDATADTFLAVKPEPIGLRLRLTEDGWQSLRKTFLGK